MESTKVDIDIISLSRQLTRLITKDFDNRLNEYGLTSHQGHIIFYLKGKVYFEGKEVHQKDIEEAFHLSKSTVSELIQRMEKNDLIKKVDTHPYFKLELTQKSLDIVDQVHKGKDQTLKRMLNGFKEEEIVKIKQNLQRMISNMKEGEE